MLGTARHQLSSLLFILFRPQRRRSALHAMDRCRREPTYEESSTAADLSKPQCTNFTSPLPGRWLLDGSIEKRVDLPECPLISSAYACRYLGTPHADEAARLRFEVRRLPARAVLCRLLARWLAGRKLVVTGDSHGAGPRVARVPNSTRHGACRHPWREDRLGNSSVHRCTAGGRPYAQDRRLCGQHHCG